jgi:hypothetical protein
VTVASIAIVVGACGPRVADPADGATEGGTGMVTSTGTIGSSGVEVSGDVDTSVVGSSSTSSGGQDVGTDTGGTTSVVDPRCDCGPGEICLGIEQDLCFDNTFECVAIPDACADDPSCANEACVEALCGWTGYCYDSCGDNPEEAFMCARNNFVCRPYTEPCPPDEKCSFEGDGSWDFSVCVPLDPDPAGVGEPCTSVDPYDGLDSCTLDAFCWNVDAGTGIGTCVPFCEPSDKGLYCAVGECVELQALRVCVVPCDPSGSDCAPGNTCVDIGGTLVCLPE